MIILKIFECICTYHLFTISDLCSELYNVKQFILFCFVFCFLLKIKYIGLPTNNHATLKYLIQAESTLRMLGWLRGGAGAMEVAEMEVDVDISTISDEDISEQFMGRGLIDGVEEAVIMEQIKKRKMGLKVLQQYDFTADLPTIPDASDPKASTPSDIMGVWESHFGLSGFWEKPLGV